MAITVSGAVITFSDASTQASSVSVLGIGGSAQSWQDVSTSRASGTTYTNSTGKPIMVAVGVGYSANATVSATVSGITVGNTGVATAGGVTSITFIVPIGATYSCVSNNSGVFYIWAELR